VSTPDPALIDTDVASVLYRGSLFERVAPGRLAGVVSDRPLAISVITLAAKELPMVTLNRRHFEPLTLHGLRLL
jgi:hypothetical protein